MMTAEPVVPVDTVENDSYQDSFWRSYLISLQNQNSLHPRTGSCHSLALESAARSMSVNQHPDTSFLVVLQKQAGHYHSYR